MATQLSPGVIFQEIDLSGYVPGVASTGAVLAGPFTWGPCDEKTLVDLEGTLVNIFGKPKTDNAEVFFSATSFLGYGKNLTVVRVASAAARNSAVRGFGITDAVIQNPGFGYTHAPSFQISGSGGGVLEAEVADGEIVAITVTEPGNYAAGIPTVTVLPFTSDAQLTVGSGSAGITYSAQVGGTGGNAITITYLDPGSASAALSVTVVSNAITVHLATNSSSVITSTATLVKAAVDASTPAHALVETALVGSGAGVVGALATANLAGGTQDSITTLAVVSAFVGVKIKNNTDYEFNYAAGQSIVGPFAGKFPGEAGNGIQLSVCDDPTEFTSWRYKSLFQGPPGTSDYAANYGASLDEVHIVVVDGTGFWTGTPGDVLEKYQFASKAVDAVDAQGSSIYYPNVLDRKSQYVRWMDHPDDTVQTAAEQTVGVTNSGINFIAVTAGAAGNLINIKYVNPGTNSASLAVVVSGNNITVNLATNTTGFITSTAAQVKTAVDASSPAAALVSTTLVSGGGSGLVVAVDPIFLQGGLDDVSFASWGTPAKVTTGNPPTYTRMSAPLDVILEGGIDGNDTLTDGEIIIGYDQFNDEDFDFALIITAAHSATVVEHCISNISEFRRDNITLLSPPRDAVVNNLNHEAVDIVTYRNLLPSSSYAVMDSNWKKTYDKYNDLFRWVPLNGDIAGLCVFTDQQRDPWFSPAGLNRGNIKGVTQLAWNPRLAYRDVLYQNGVNPVVTFPGQGTVLFGDKTMLAKPSAFDRINVRRLFIVIEKAISKAAKYTLFELNDDSTRAQFRGLIDPYLRDVQGRRGMYAYKIYCDATNNTPQVIDTNGFNADIFIQPAKSINTITLRFIATRTGVSFDELIGKV